MEKRNHQLNEMNFYWNVESYEYNVKRCEDL